MKVPSHEYQQTVVFYRDLLGFKEIVNSPDTAGSTQFHFGDKYRGLTGFRV